jgi:enamine deaminase RidA (YjgF/YER057c/UK114 family)
MQVLVYDWLGHEWIWLRGEGRPELDTAGQTDDLLRRMESELELQDASLANTMRTRLWARDRAARDEASRVRVAALSGRARSASSSFIAPSSLDSTAAIAVELWAMKSDDGGLEKRLVEYEPRIVPLRYLISESVLVLSGVTSVLPTLDQQVVEILGNIESSLQHAGATWENAVKISSTLERNQSLAELRDLLKSALDGCQADVEFDFADGYSTPGKLVEIEVTAQLGTL